MKTKIQSQLQFKFGCDIISVPFLNKTKTSFLYRFIFLVWKQAKKNKFLGKKSMFKLLLIDA